MEVEIVVRPQDAPQRPIHHRMVDHLLEVGDAGQQVVARIAPREHVLDLPEDPLVLAHPAWTSVPDEGLRALPVALVDCADLRPPGDVDFADKVGREQGKNAED